MNAIPIKLIVTHRHPHLDEIFGIWMLKRFGETRYPGISTAGISYFDAGSALPPGTTADDYERQGVLLVGIGGGRLDEHPGRDGGRKEKESATSLVAKDLGIAREPMLEKTIAFVTGIDQNGGAHAYDISTMVKLFFEHGVLTDAQVFDWAFAAFEAKLFEQNEFWNIAKPDVDAGTVTEYCDRYGSRITVAVYRSDCRAAQQYARYKGATLIVQQSTTGNVQVFTAKKSARDLRPLAVALRTEERRLKGLGPTTEPLDQERCACEGTWYYHVSAQSLLNGSKTAVDVPPTAIPFDTVVALTLKALELEPAD